MPNLVDNNTQIPAARVKMNDDTTGYVNRSWYRWFFNIYQAIEAGRRYGSFYDTTTQTAAAANTAYAMKFNSTASKINDGALQYGVYTGTPNSRVYVDNTGVYNIQFSAQFVSTNSASKDVTIWLAVDGTAVTDSATKITMSGSSGSYVAAWNFVINLSSGSYFELYWETTNTNVSILAAAASGHIPAIPSVILTVTSIVGA
ncbi:hypothetical protein [Caudoviricetes sp.]|jgi:hypothetical protein|nr:hypothetical protein [Caudoviricetes sp.]